MPSRPGRPREFTYAKRADVVARVHQGATVAEAARIVGVSLRTVQLAAQRNDDFHHDLQLAKHYAPVDPEKLMQRAARSHWRAAAWLRERTDPDRYGKRKPGTCSPKALVDLSNWLIETALEATPPEHRAEVYRRMRSVADEALEILMPDQRAQVGSPLNRNAPVPSPLRGAEQRARSPERPSAGGSPCEALGRGYADFQLPTTCPV